ncbi:TOMM precursor leader peptide-binding protein [Maribacter sp. IgM3_T14_3]|uniref:TOMM precursor leader peptide-binding protein n=1 Tax=Maribacter sp. IgM3_T14_3 TaxID=3415140 RepID=UPI003C6EAF20
MIHKYDVFEDVENNVYQIRTKGDVFLVRFEGDDKKEIFLKLISLFESKKISFKDLVKKLKQSFDESKVLSVVQELKDSGLFTENYVNNPVENSKGLSFQLRSGQEDFSRITTTKNIEIVGKGEIFETFKKQIYKKDFGEVYFSEINDKNPKKIIDSALQRSDLLIVESNEWNPELLEFINIKALEADKAWMLVRGMWLGKGSIGPLFYGRETGCYSCLSARVKSNIEHLSYFLAYENYLMKEGKSSKPDWIPTGLQDIIVTMALYDALKFLSEWDVPETYGHLINIFPSLSIEKHKLLKNPLCTVCKPELEYNISPWVENIVSLNEGV